MKSARFQDYFSRVSVSYARFRPTYPSGLFADVARHAPALDCAWDCATGSGQAALGLSRHFREVIATGRKPTAGRARYSRFERGISRRARRRLRAGYG